MNEANETAQIYVDMDGVLCDFIGGVQKRTGQDFASTDLTPRAKQEPVSYTHLTLPTKRIV